MTLITRGSSSAKRGRCDARCYDAKGSLCVCCCGGLNHGKSLAGALSAMGQTLFDIIKDEERGLIELAPGFVHRCSALESGVGLESIGADEDGGLSVVVGQLGLFQGEGVVE